MYIISNRVMSLRRCSLATVDGVRMG